MTLGTKIYLSFPEYQQVKQRERENSKTPVKILGAVKNCLGIPNKMAMGEDRTSPKIAQ